MLLSYSFKTSTAASTSLCMTHPHPPIMPKGQSRGCVAPPPHLLPGNVFDWASAKGEKRGPAPVTHRAPDRPKSRQPEGARGFVFPPPPDTLHTPHSSGDQLWSECVELGDAAAINMRQRARVSDSCTVEQGHAVLALSERAAPKKANPVWRH